MKYTSSKDGVERITLWTAQRFDMKELHNLKAIAVYNQMSVHELLSAALSDGLRQFREAYQTEKDYETSGAR